MAKVKVNGTKVRGGDEVILTVNATVEVWDDGEVRLIFDDGSSISVSELPRSVRVAK